MSNNREVHYRDAPRTYLENVTTSAIPFTDPEIKCRELLPRTLDDGGASSLGDGVSVADSSTSMMAIVGARGRERT